MTTVQQPESNPFALLMNPEEVFAAMAGSDRLARLKSRIWRPLDKPLIAHADADDTSDSDESSDPAVEAEDAVG